jgi:DNA damage-inducible protein 1
MKVADLFLACSFTIMEVNSFLETFQRSHWLWVQGREVDLLLGLDMLKAHQACIDLEKGVLRIQGREVKFLAEHELPEKARVYETGDDQESGSHPSGSGPSNPTSTGQNQGSSFPGQGHALGAAPRTQAERSQPQSQQPQPQQPPASRYPESTIRVLMDLGATRGQAIQYLDAAGGNVDVAASFLFSG